MRDFKFWKDVKDEFKGYEGIIDVYRQNKVNTDIYHDLCYDIHSINDEKRHDQDFFSWEDHSIEYMNDYMPVYAAELLSSEDYRFYVEPDSADWGDDREEYLVVIGATETGIVPEAQIWKEVEEGKISDEIKAQVIYSASKKAKTHRGWHENRYDDDWKARKQAHEDEDLYKHYYNIKDVLLEDVNVSEIHFDNTNGQIYEYRKIGDFGYHSPVESHTKSDKYIEQDEDDFDNNNVDNNINSDYIEEQRENAKEWAKEYGVPLKELNEQLYISEEGQNILCDEFVEFVYDKYIELNINKEQEKKITIQPSNYEDRLINKLSKEQSPSRDVTQEI